MFSNLKRYLKRSRTLYRSLGPIFALYRNTVMSCARLFGGTDMNSVVFSSFNNLSYNDNPRYISEALHELAPDVNIVWLFKDGQKARERLSIPDYITIYDAIENKGVAALARSKVVVDNFNKHFYLRFPGKHQCYIQTWHGDRAFKKVGLDDTNHFNAEIEKKAQLCVAGSDYGERQFRSAFAYNGEVLKVGTARNDILVQKDPALAREVRARLDVDDQTQLLIFAPTYRDAAKRSRTEQHSGVDISRALDTLEETTGKKWRCLLRAHYLSMGVDNAKPDPRLIDATGYQEMAELMLVADAMITDYSSCAGDYALMGKPIWLYQDDFEDYINNNRALYFKMEDSPYLVAHDRDELDALIRGSSPEQAAENCRAILDFYGTHECGHAAKTIAEYILKQLGK